MGRLEQIEKQLKTLDSHMDMAVKSFNLYISSPTFHNMIFAEGVYSVFKESINVAADDEGFMDWKPRSEGYHMLNDYLLEYAIGSAFIAAKKELEHFDCKSESEGYDKKYLEQKVVGDGSTKYKSIRYVVRELVYAGKDSDVLEVLTALRNARETNLRQENIK